MDNVQDKIKNIKRKLAKSDIKDANNPGSGDDDFYEALDDFFKLQNDLADTSPETIKIQQKKDKILRFKLGVPKQNDVIEDIKSVLDALDSLADKMIETDKTDEVTDIASTIYDVLLILSDDIHESSESLGEIDLSSVDPIPELDIIGKDKEITIFEDKDFLANRIKEITEMIKNFDYRPDMMEVINLVYCWNTSLGLLDLFNIVKQK